jgi:nitrous oxidase accessory protein
VNAVDRVTGLAPGRTPAPWRAARRGIAALRAAAQGLGLSAALALALVPGAAHARTTRVPAVRGAAQAAISAAAPGDTLILEAGVHPGPLLVDRALTVRGERGAIVDGGGSGSTLTVTASGTRVEDLAVRHCGTRVITVDAGVRVLEAANVTLTRLALGDVLYGVDVERSPNLVVRDCVLRGRVAGGGDDGEGNGLHVWYSTGATLTGNDVSHFEDAVYLSFANDARAIGNRLHDDGRYGFHTMYCQGSVLERNVFTRNAAGCAIMFSNHLRVAHNRFEHNRGPRTYGLLLRDCSDGTFEGNALVDNTIAMFLDNSNRNRVRENLLLDNGWGVLMFSSCAGNEFTRNAFLHDDYAVAIDMKYTDNRFDDGRVGNYWSDHAPYDLDGDGLGDAPYSPVGTFAFLSKQYPDLSVLAKSPAVAALSVAEQVLPAMRPSEAMDRHPLVAPPPLARQGLVALPRGRRATPWAAAAFGSIALLSLGGLGVGRWRA